MSVLIVPGTGCAGESASRTYSVDDVLQAFLFEPSASTHV
jgi:hypothetical protein